MFKVINIRNISKETLFNSLIYVVIITIGATSLSLYLLLDAKISRISNENAFLKIRVSELGDEIGRIERIYGDKNSLEHETALQKIDTLSRRIEDVYLDCSGSYSRIKNVEGDISTINSELSLIRLQMLTR
ncbi:hypothetical protein [Phaeospirillum tilakii]|uniref:Four helix bundle sensory module for signal transduction n=1 Tax=Phaeospirillum tilakii TaxID=741673 RepID=A0ABW5C7C9_9PROT